jgi:site-specific recombinase XerD
MTEQWSCPIQDAYEMFRMDCEARRFTESTLRFYRFRLFPFIHWCEEKGIVSLRAITSSHIRIYLVSLQERGLGGYSQHAAARAIKTFLRFCVREELLPDTPMKRVSMPRVDRPILPAFDQAGISRIMAAITTDRDKAIVLCLLDTGCRAAEFVAWNGGDVDMSAGTVQVRRGKGGKGRVVYLGKKARKTLLRYYMRRGTPGPDEPVWLSLRGGRRLTTWGLGQLLKRIGTAAGVEYCTPHTFRRTFALWSLRNGMNIYALQRLMGHAGLEVLQRYLALVEHDLGNAHDAASPVDNWHL